MLTTVTFRAANAAEVTAQGDDLRYYHLRTGMVLTNDAMFALGYGSDCVLPVVGISAAEHHAMLDADRDERFAAVYDRAKDAGNVQAANAGGES